MRIGVDARELCGQATGVGRYLSGLLGVWATDARARSHEFVLYAPEPPAALPDPQRFPIRVVPGSRGTWWEQAALPRAAACDRLDVLFAPAYTAPLLTGLPTVVVIHDVSFVGHPEWFTPRDGLRRRWLTRRAALRARAVIAVSEFSRREIVERLGVPAARVHVVLNGVTSPAVGDAPCAREARVLYVGSILNRRHVPDLVRAFRTVAVAHPGAALDIVGDNRTYPHEDPALVIAAEGLEGRVEWHRYLPDGALRALYSRAGAFAFLSEYEGFGLTPLEALAAGIPPVLLDTPVARETCGDAAFYVPSGDIGATSAALERALFDEAARAAVLSAAPRTLARFAWPRAAGETLAVIEAAAHAS
ncbi:MAG: glycosyltransferase family 4 protein [Solirubrobacteraceae bacterium]